MRELIHKLANNYFINFEKKNIHGLSEMFEDNISLFDPVVQNVVGKKNVLKVNKDMFDTHDEIKFTMKEIFVDASKMTAIGEVEFFLGKTKINVVDIIKFNKDMKIISITAYLDT